ncbi:MAG: alpha/beta hydrolase [Elusimicrobiota bacterium]
MKKNIFLCFLLFVFSCFLFSQESVFLETDDGWKIHAKFVKPKKDFIPTLLLIHSQKSNHTEWKKWFGDIEKYGFGWMALDLRGHGISTYKTDGSTQSYLSFSISDFSNDYNKMIRDIDSAVIYLSSMGITEDKIILVGSNLGANLAMKYAAINKNIYAAVVINPSTNINDVLTVNPARLYGERPILFVTSQNNRRKMGEGLILYEITKKKTGFENTFLIVEYAFKSADDISKSGIYKILNWIKNPVMPKIIEIDDILISSQTVIDTITASSPYIILNDDEEKENKKKNE